MSSYDCDDFDNILDNLLSSYYKKYYDGKTNIDENKKERFLQIINSKKINKRCCQKEILIFILLFISTILTLII